MESLDTKALEDSLNTVTGKGPAVEEQAAPQMSTEEEIGFHKGAINTLVAERNELVKMVANVEAILQAHLKRLKELGVDIGAGATEQKE
ncbi:hypothetical protein HOA55_03390 [archaeon]|jgi:hypothetical protein|nr:hypothetical protein [archaeon]MBT3577384.1 hypothetical protein [archaeon]MBT6820373.1 hypothetical protein [archaeon]MBT6956152.1 hypothetical protein [archaeon]MBT7025187.1 hypothetical protein [archaeon]